MPRPDDSSLNPEDRRFVEDRAKRLLDRADAWGRFPTQVDDIMAAAELKVAAASIFDPALLLSFLKEKGAQTAHAVKAAVAKILGVYDEDENTVHIDPDVVATKQTFLKLHEAGHHELPTHRKIFRFFLDCEKTLHPDIADQFEREANNFARFVLFQGSTFGEMAADEKLGIKSPMKLAEHFGASIYASVREFTRTNRHACLAYVLEPMEYVLPDGYRAVVRRIETSPSFSLRFGLPADSIITQRNALGRLLPIGRKMTKPTAFAMSDRNGERQEMIGEAFSTKYNIFILIYAAKNLAGTETAGRLVTPVST